VPGFESIVGQKQPIRILTTYIRNGTIPHALLFTGIEGVGKKTTAMTFAMVCNCSDRAAITDQRKRENHLVPDEIPKIISPCGKCRSCKKIISGNHPDIIHIKPSGSYIKIAQIRSLIHTLAMKPYEALYRVILLSEAQAMNPEAGNALLKALEEPPPQTVIILTARQASDLLPTVMSRCQHIRFSPLSGEDLKGMLRERRGLDPDDAEVIIMMANGSYDRALALLDADWVSHRKWLLSASGLDQPHKLSSRSTFQHLAFAESLTHKKDIIIDSLEILKSWLRDLVIFSYSPEKIINKDLTAHIQSVSQKMALESLLSKIDIIQSAQKAIQSNANLRLSLETMMFRLAIG
jgi:DNA polymerase-3 subunit delta'